MLAQLRQVDMGRWTKVETNGPGGHATVELQPENVGLLVWRETLFQDNRSKDFDETRSEVRGG